MKQREQTDSKNTTLAILSVGLLTFIGILHETSMNVTYPILVKQFGQPLSTIQWITTGYLLTVTIVMGTTAYLLRQIPARWLHLGAGVAFILGSCLAALTNNFALLLLGRIIQGIATGFSTPIMFQLIFTQVPKEKLGLMTGVAGMIISFAPALGPTYGGIVLSFANWRMIFWLLLPLALISILGGQVYVRNQPMGNKTSFSYGALVLLGLSLFFVVYAMSIIGSQGISASFLIKLLIGLVFFAIFIYVNNHGQSQLLNLAIFKQSTIVLSALTYFILQFANIGLSVTIPTYAEYVLSASSLVAGLCLLPGSFVGALISPYAGKLADKYGFKRPITIGGILFFLGNLGFALLQPVLTPALIVLCHIVFRAGFNLSFANSISNASTLVDKKNVSDVNSAFNMIQQFAGSLGVSIATALISLSQKHGQGSLAIRSYRGGQMDFILFAILGLVTVCLIWRNFRLQEKAANK
ncbi:MFS transporter [Lactobacillus sp.]|uniref:MFS transporter n=1 Tax=Lactobacillus sp. TaxID=1591 RepID=UPI003EFAE7A2